MRTGLAGKPATPPFYSRSGPGLRAGNERVNVLPAASLERHHAAAQTAQSAHAQATQAATGRELLRREPAGRELVRVRVVRRGDGPA